MLPGGRPGGTQAAGQQIAGTSRNHVGGYRVAREASGLSKFFSKLRAQSTLTGALDGSGQQIRGAEVNHMSYTKGNS